MGPVVEYVFLDWLQELAIDPNEACGPLSLVPSPVLLRR